MNPIFQGILNFVMGKWKRYGLISVYLVNTNIFLFTFDSEGGRDLVLKDPILLIEDLWCCCNET